MGNPPRTASEFGRFFKTLARRFRNETHLSDMTYTTIQVIPRFRDDFIHYFFDHLDTNESIEVKREHRLPGGGQPDFVFVAQSWDLIVENKIWDKEYHPEYGKAPLREGRPLPKVGLIANHRVKEALPEGWIFHEWMHFVDVFSQNDYGESQAVFDAYLTYVREICNVA